MNETKQKRISKRAAEFPLPSSSDRKVSKSNKPPPKMDAEILNLPGKDFIVTKEIFKNNVCRLCATYHETGPKLVPLFLYQGGFRPSKIINTCLPFRVHKDDGLPEFVCRPCADMLLAWRDFRENCEEAIRILTAQMELSPAQIADGTHSIPRNERSQLTKTVESVIASYLLNIGSIELFCQKCDLRTSSEDFVQHLESKHEDIKGHDAVEAFVKDHVTFEEVLMSDSDADVISIASTEPSGVIPLRLDCPMCCSQFSNRSGLFDHLNQHPEVNLENGISCCGVSRDKDELVRHLSKEHNYQLATDTTALTTRSAYLQTMAESDITTDKRPASRVKDETNQKRIPAVCPDCNRTFSNKYNMLNHMKSHSKAENVKFDCECGKSYTTRGNLVAHRRTAHSGKLPHLCTVCGDRFRSRSARDIHSRLHTGERPFPCPHCAQSFRAKNSRDKHQETHAPRKYQCELCGDSFRRKSHLRYHVGTHRRRPT